MLQGLVGMELFHSEYNAVREAHKVRRDARKGERALQRLLDPKMEVRLACQRLNAFLIRLHISRTAMVRASARPCMR